MRFIFSIVVLTAMLQCGNDRIEQTVYLFMGDAAGQPGESVDVDLTAMFPIGHEFHSIELSLSGFQGIVEFDALLPDEGMLGNAGWQMAVNSTDSLLYIAAAGVQNLFGFGSLFSLRFQIPETLPSDTAPILFHEVLFNNGELAVSASDGEITINCMMDCSGVCNGSAVIDDCGVCTEGNTGIAFNQDMDCAGVCFGSAELDICGQCDDNPANDGLLCSGCTDPTALNADEDCFIINESGEAESAPCLVDDGSCLYVEIYNFSEGNNLISFVGLPEPATPANIFAPVQDIMISVIGEGVTATYIDVLGLWVGSLSVIEPTAGYWVSVESDADLEIASTRLPTDTLFELHAGNNLVSYLGPDGSSIGDALPDDIETYITLIVGAGLSAMPHPFFPGEWVGSLTASGLQRKAGYWIRTTEDIAFSWNQ